MSNDTPRTGISIRAYARLRAERGLSGATDTAVRKAIKAGRITPLADGSIDPDAADRAWADNTDPTQVRHADVSPGEPGAPAPHPDPSPEPQRRGSRQRPHLEVVNGGRNEKRGDADPMKPQVREWQESQPHGGSLKRAKEEESPFAIAMRDEQLRKLRLNNDKLEGLLVDRAAVERHAFEVVRATRDAFNSRPDKMAGTLAAKLGVPEHDMLWALREFVSETLAELSRRSTVEAEEPDL